MPGGIIPPDGRQPAPKGTGKQARRHDLEKPKGSVPGLQGSDLQYGDVSMLRQAQRTAPTGSSAKRIQAPAAGADQPSGRQTAGPQQQNGQAEISVPDPMAFLVEKSRGTLQGAPRQLPQRRVDVSFWTPIAKKLANSPTASGNLRQAFLHQYTALTRRPYVPDVFVANLQEMDNDVESLLNG